MKKIFIICFSVVVAVALNAQKPTATPAAQPAVVVTKATSAVSFGEVKHNFGKLKQNVPASYTFTLKNNGAKPLIIEQATAQCGCTTPVYDKKPILKGKSSPLVVTYNAANAGPFTKTVTVKFLNIAEPTILTIEGEVLKDTEAPKKG